MFSNKVRLVYVAILAGVVSMLAMSCSPALPAVITIGAAVGQKGDAAAYGVGQKKGIDLAVKEINSTGFLGSGKTLKVVYSDSGSSTEDAAASFNTLLDQKVSGLVGPTLSTQALFADPLAQKKGVPVIAISNTAPGITEIGDYIFRCSLPESSVIDGTIKTASSKYAIHKVGLLWGANESYSEAGYQAFKTAIKKYNVEIKQDLSYPVGTTNFREQISQILASNPDAVCVSALATQAIQIVKQARELGYKGTIIGGNGFNSPELIKQAGSAAESVMVGTAWNSASQAAVNLDFIRAFQKEYGSQPDQFAAQAYTAIRLYAQAVSSGRSPVPQTIRDQLLLIRDFQTPLGSFSFNGREPAHPSAVQIVQDGKYVIVN